METTNKNILIFFAVFLIRTIEFFEPGTDPLIKIKLFSRSDLTISRFLIVLDLLIQLNFTIKISNIVPY